MKRKMGHYQYYVEGADEEKLIHVLKSEMFMICPGKVEKFNVVQDELIRSCNIKQIRELTGSKSNKDFKHALIVEKNLASKLKSRNFDIQKFWISSPTNQYRQIINNAMEIKF